MFKDFLIFLKICQSAHSFSGRNRVIVHYTYWLASITFLSSSSLYFPSSVSVP